MISLIVPVYNVKDYIKDFLDSVIMQTFEDFETILVDDGSTDGTQYVLDEYQQEFPQKFKVIHKENGGCVSAWKKGVEMSQGEYITFADPDDILVPTLLENLFAKMKENDADMVIGCYKEFINRNNIYRKTDKIGLDEGLYEGEQLNKLKENLLGNKFHRDGVFLLFKWAKLFKRNIVFKTLKYTRDEISFGDDVCINLTSIYESKKLYYTYEPLYIYRIREGSLTTIQFDNKQIDDAVNLINAVRFAVNSYGYMNSFIYYNDPSYHIIRLMRKINNLKVSKKEKKLYLQNLKKHDFVASYNLKEAKKYISLRRYIAIWLLQHSKYSILLRIL